MPIKKSPSSSGILSFLKKKFKKIPTASKQDDTYDNNLGLCFLFSSLSYPISSLLLSLSLFSLSPPLPLSPLYPSLSISLPLSPSPSSPSLFLSSLFFSPFHSYNIVVSAMGTGNNKPICRCGVRIKKRRKKERRED